MGNKGIKKVCPRCKFLLFSAASLEGAGNFTQIIRCHNPDCRLLFRVDFDQKTFVTISRIEEKGQPGKKILLALAIISFVASVAVNAVKANKPTCDSFKTPDRTWAEAKIAAQKTYDADPETYENLDGYDKDGKVCE